jgi:hypothetical protein
MRTGKIAQVYGLAMTVFVTVTISPYTGQDEEK